MEFEQAMKNVTVDDLAAICGQGDYGALQALAEAVVTSLTDLVDASLGILAALSCERIIPLYVSAGIFIFESSMHLSYSTSLHFLIQ